MESFPHFAFRQQPSPFSPQIHDQRQFDIYNNAETLSEYSVDNSDVSPRAAKPESQTFFALPPNFSPYSMASVPSPYSSSSSSFQSESPPSEPFKTMDNDYTSSIAKPDDFQYNHPVYDQSDQYIYNYGTATDMPAMTHPSVYAETYSQELVAAPLPTCGDEATKFQSQHYQQWQQPQPSPQRTQPTSYPSYSAQAGRMRSLSDGAPLGPTSSADDYSALYAQQTYPGQVKYTGHVHTQDTNVRPTSTFNSYNTSRSSFLPPFSRLRSFSHEQEQAQQRNTSQAEYVRRERERSISDAALPRMHPSVYTSSPYPSVYRSFDQNVHTANTHTTTTNSPATDIQSHAGYPQQQRAPQSGVSALRSMPVMYGSQPTYKFAGQAADPSHTRSDSGGQDQGPHSSDELSPVLGIRQLEIQSGCEPRHLNGNVKGGTDDVIIHNGYATSGSGRTAVKEEEEEEENAVRQEDLHANKVVAPDIPDVEGDEDAEGDYDDDDNADADYEDGDEYDPDDDDDGEFVVSRRRNTAPENTRNLRTRSSTKTRSSRFQPYPYSSNPRSTSKSTSSQAITSRPRTRMRTRHINSLPVPVPVPNLTKKSRGRRVPTVETLIPPSVGKSGKSISRREGDEGDDKNARTYTCDAAGCGKCFARGEHLKRHVRSIHTYEKPHKCPFPGCEKDFSRHDNLRQHLRVHKGYVPVKADFQGDAEEMW